MLQIPEILNLYRCYICNSYSDLLCNRCFSKLEKVENIEKLYDLNLTSLYKYNTFSSKILLMSKYPPYHFHILKVLLRNSNLDVNFKNKIFCPVPLSSLKMFERKFNQAELIANELKKIYGGEVFPVLNRVRDSKPLFSLNKSARKNEMGGVFRVSFWGSKLLQKETLNIVLVDDLVTTGETIKDCIRALYASGFKNIEVFSLFRA